MALGDAVHGGQPDPRARKVGGPMEALEWDEQPALVRRIEPGPVVLHPEALPLTADHRFHRDRASEVRPVNFQAFSSRFVRAISQRTGSPSTTSPGAIRV